MDSDQSPHHVVDLDETGGDDRRGQRRGRPPLFVLKFEDLTYSVKTPKMKSSIFSLPTSGQPTRAVVDGKNSGSRTKNLLNSVSGEGREGEITAVLGASGSGKSTLIDALANRISHGSMKGSITLNGQPIHGRLLKVISAYVMQDDLLFPMLTVEETLMYAAEFRLPRSLPIAKKNARVQTLMDHLGLRGAAGTIIGDEGHRGISGGERRRVSIGIDIIHDPIILFLDEPMSGLDSTSAFMVAKVLQRIAHSGSIVVMSIHQPSSRILGLLDRLIFLSQGSTVFNGSPDDLHPYLSSFGHPIPENENRTEFTLDLIRDLEGSPNGVRRLVEHNKSWQLMKKPISTTTFADNNGGSSLKDAIAVSISRGKLVSGAVGSAGETEKLANPFWHEVCVLTRRAFTNTRRTPEVFATRLATVLITGFILSTVYWRLDTSPKGVQERLGFFAFAMSTMFYACADTLPVFLQERYIFMRETAYNAYRRSSYVLSNAIVAIPSLVILSISFSLVTFFAVGLAGGAEGFAFYFFITFATLWVGGSFVTFLSGVVTNVTLGYTVVVAVLAYFLLLSGFFITRDRIPDYWLWLHYISMMKYPYQAVLRNEFEVNGRCFARGTQIFDNSPAEGAPESTKLKMLKNMSSTLGMTDITASTCLTTGSDVLHEQAITGLSKWDCLLITVAGGFLFRVLFYFSLRLGSKNKRR